MTTDVASNRARPIADGAPAGRPPEVHASRCVVAASGGSDRVVVGEPTPER
ncbi:MAG TPA: hypothetical protein VMQ81_03705 [Acidimicrobiia bacterium]|nr:hypothetical protein [Acidimicrobiia bacterium]